MAAAILRGGGDALIKRQTRTMLLCSGTRTRNASESKVRGQAAKGEGDRQDRQGKPEGSCKGPPNTAISLRCFSQSSNLQQN